MGIQVSWHDEHKTIMLQVFEGKWTLEDYYRLVDEAAALIRPLPHTVHIIADASRSALPPSQMVSGMRYALNKMPSNQGITVFVQPGTLASALIDLAKRFSPRAASTVFIAASREDALALIAQHADGTSNGT